jgi:RHH-type proline utilization regulon transcriptional repressor/proline dehydrogenase/delta 1-pyrroline-5-carboxylate dehydrogenase
MMTQTFTAEIAMPAISLFAEFAPPIREQSPLRQAITAAYRRL